MKKTLLSFLFVFSGIVLMNAQPQITTLPAAGDSVNIFGFDEQGWLNAGPSGANVTWDFSGIQVQPIPDFFMKMKAASAAPQFALYPSADLAAEMWLTGVPFAVGNIYFDISSNTVSALGIHSNFDTDHSIYTNPSSEIPVPLTYLKTFTDTYREVDYSNDNNDSTIETGTQSFLVDGYGTLKIPGGSIPNVLRIRSIDQYTDSIYEDGVLTVETNTDTSYHWRVQGFAYDVLYVSEVNSPNRNGQLSYETALTSISKFSMTNVNVFPNPTAELITITGIQQGTAVLHDVEGRIIKSEQISGHSVLNIAELESGIYLLQLSTEEGNEVIRIVKH